MGRRRRKSGGAGLSLIILALAGFVVFGRDMLVVAGVIAVAWAAYRFVSKSGTSSGEVTASSLPVSAGRDSRGVHIRLGASPAPRATLQNNPSRFWVDPAGNVTVRGRSIGGMVYVGQGLASLGSYDIEPALIDPTLPAANERLDLFERRTGYWPSYTTSSPEARGAYLQWLSSGRKDPSADIGLVFLYFYGLERRTLADTLTVDVPASEIEAIRAEVQRLLEIYTSGSFQNYARGFLDVLNAKSLPSELYRAPPPSSPQLSLQQKVGLAQCAQDAVPLPVDWAITWLENDTSERLPIVATRCKSEFHKLFAIRYAEAYGDGIDPSEEQNEAAVGLPRSERLLPWMGSLSCFPLRLAGRDCAHQPRQEAPFDRRRLLREPGWILSAQDETGGRRRRP